MHVLTRYGMVVGFIGVHIGTHIFTPLNGLTDPSLNVFRGELYPDIHQDDGLV